MDIKKTGYNVMDDSGIPLMKLNNLICEASLILQNIDLYDISFGTILSTISTKNKILINQLNERFFFLTVPVKYHNIQENLNYYIKEESVSGSNQYTSNGVKIDAVKKFEINKSPQYIFI